MAVLTLRHRFQHLYYCVAAAITVLLPALALKCPCQHQDHRITASLNIIAIISVIALLMTMTYQYHIITAGMSITVSFLA